MLLRNIDAYVMEPDYKSITLKKTSLLLSPSLLHLCLLNLSHLPSWMCDMWQTRKPKVEIKRVGKRTCLVKKQGYVRLFFTQIPTPFMTLLLPLTIITYVLLSPFRRHRRRRCPLYRLILLSSL